MEGRNAGGHQENVPFIDEAIDRDLSHAALQPGRHAERGQGPGRLQGAAIVGLPQAAPTPAAPAIDFPKIDKELVKTNFFEYLDFALQFAPADPDEKAIRDKLARIGI